jgi:glycosyltransferase involved in cell wall biosynthesis
MKIGIASTHMWSETAFRNAGISKSSYRLIDGLSTSFPSDIFTVFANTAFQPSADWSTRPNLNVSCTVPIGRGKRALWEFFGSADEIRKGDFDVWLATSHIAPWRSNVPTAAIIHDMVPMIYPELQDWAQSAYLRFALVHVARKVDLILTNSRQTKSDIVKFAKVDPEKIVVVPFGPGAELTPKDPGTVSSQELEGIPYQRFFFSLGTLEPRKNLSRLFEALAQLTEPEFADVGLVIGGGRGWREEGIFETLEKLGIGKRVTFLGYVPDERLPALFAASLGFVFPSIYEGFGMPLVESMRMGAIPLAGNCGAMKEVVGDSAITFDPYSVPEITDAMRRCLRLSQCEREKLLASGAVQAEQFNWTECAHQTHAALQKLVENKRRR